jgi:hypothetical protein
VLRHGGPFASRLASAAPAGFCCAGWLLLRRLGLLRRLALAAQAGSCCAGWLLLRRLAVVLRLAGTPGAALHFGDSLHAFACRMAYRAAVRGA